MKKEGGANYNSKNSYFKIAYDAMGILNKMRKFSNYKYNFRRLYSKQIAICFGSAIVDKRITNFTKAIKICPSKYRIPSILTIPYYSFKVLLRK